MGTGVIHIDRKFAKLDIGQPYQSYIEFSANILIESNTFAEIVGCPSVFTSLIHLCVIDGRSSATKWVQTSGMILRNIYPQPAESVLSETNS